MHIKTSYQKNIVIKINCEKENLHSDEEEQNGFVWPLISNKL
jgi:hypothetical protein